MPEVFVMQALDARGRVLAEAWSWGAPPDPGGASAFDHTVDRFFGDRCVRIAADLVMACRGCGCTDDRACVCGCEWVEDDLCSRCAGPRIIR